MERLVDSWQAMHLLGDISRATLDRWIAAGYVRPYRVGHNFRYRPEELRKVPTLGSKQASRLLGISRSTLYRLSKAGDVPCKWIVKHRKPQWMYSREELEAWLETKRIERT